MIGKTLRELNLLNHFGVTVSRIIRNDVEFVPKAETRISRGDVLFSVGEHENLLKFAQFSGHRARMLDETDIISLSAGITAGLIIGMMPIGFSDSHSFSLGATGGPLLVALVLSHFGGIGPIRGHIPRAARYLMTEIGLVFFLAGAGVKAGSQLIPIVQSYGLSLLIMGALVTLLPMTVGFLYARKVLKLNLSQTLGGTCGSMTSTPGLGAITSKTDSDIPAISYAAAYPVALILMTLCAQFIVSLFS